MVVLYCHFKRVLTSCFHFLSFLLCFFFFNMIVNVFFFYKPRGSFYAMYQNEKPCREAKKVGIWMARNIKYFKKINEIYTLYMLVMQCHYILLIPKSLPQSFWTPLLSHFPTWNCFWECPRFLLCTCAHI